MNPPEPSEARSAPAARNALADWTRALQYTQQSENAPHNTILSVVRERAAEQGDRPALIGEAGQQLSYRELVDRADRYGEWALRHELGEGEVVGLLMANCPDYVAIWFGITQMRCAVALINTNLAGGALAHSIRAAGVRHIIVSHALLPSVVTLLPELPAGMKIWVHGEAAGDDFPRIDAEIASLAPHYRDPDLSRRPQGGDRALLIYTSGTTGLPKAATVTHARVLEWSAWFAGMMDAGPEDRLYDCLPLYHSTGGVVAIGSILSRGGSVVIRTRFSASRFWDDIVATGCTILQYIGELCRYLTRTEPRPSETAHRLRLACGNGMGGDVWAQFQHRFAVPRILEFYAATEGSVSLYNCEGKPGAIGRIPAFLRHRFPIALVRTDIETGEPLRDGLGLCIACGADEPGEALGQIVNTSTSPARRFDGYTDPQASARKILRDVFAPGDQWFRTGDLMRRDRAGYYYFVDRAGDTFRWKGENVSTMEVASTLSAFAGVLDAVVWGVAIPGAEGRAGMAAITTSEGFSLDGLRRHLSAHLPAYAHPLFVQLCEQIAVTGTFKLTKAPLAAAGLATPAAAGRLWFNDRKQETFIPCDPALLHQVQSGDLSL